MGIVPEKARVAFLLMWGQSAQLLLSTEGKSAPMAQGRGKYDLKIFTTAVKFNHFQTTQMALCV
jgi:hypothetical protein